MDDVAVRLARLKREAKKEWKRKWRKRIRQAAPATAAEWRALAGEAVRALLKIALIIALPFAVLVRGSVFFYEHGTTSVWLARKFTSRGGRGGRALVIPLAKWVALPLVVFYCGYSLVYVASVHAKSPPVRAYYGSLHPLLRLALSTLILIDRDMLITDSGRLPEDYGRMGLPTNTRTRHL